MSGTVNYSFNNENDFAFYILNSVCHDWIHDFNNYTRMGSILKYIMHLLNPNLPVPVDTRDTDESKQSEKKELTALKETITGIGGKKQIGGILPDDDATRDISHIELYDSTMDEFTNEIIITRMSERATSSDRSIQELLFTSVERLNNIRQKLRDGSVTRGLAVRLDAIQQLEYFVDEIKLLVISRIGITPQLSGGNNSIQKGGVRHGRAIDIISKEDVLSSIDSIVEEIKEPELVELKNLFIFLMHTYDYLIIPGISQLEVFSNSIINDAVNLFIAGECQTIDIKQQAKMYLDLLTSQSKLEKDISSVAETPSIVDIESTTGIESIPDIQSVTNDSNITIDEITRYIIENRFNLKSPPISRYIKSPSNRRRIALSPMSPQRVYVGGSLNSSTYTDNIEIVNSFKDFIALIRTCNRGDIVMDITQEEAVETGVVRKPCLLYALYSGLIKINELNIAQKNLIYTEYMSIIGSHENIIKLVSGIQTYNVKIKIINNLWQNITRTTEGVITELSSGARSFVKNFQQLVDSMIEFIFILTIAQFEDFIKRQEASVSAEREREESGTTLTPPAKTAVQRISKLVAEKVLELTMLTDITDMTDEDLKMQITILLNVITRNMYGQVDNQLIDYFLMGYKNNYRGPDYTIMTGNNSLEKLHELYNDCSHGQMSNCRVINNAIPAKQTIPSNRKVIKEDMETKQIVVCPTSSVCDAMGFFGSCLNPRDKREYHDMDFIISYGEGTDFYSGTTNIKSGGRLVNINYGIKYKELELYNFVNVDITGQPTILSANNSFKGVINRILEIWKAHDSVRDIDELWGLLYGTDYFLSILKLGSQKAVGDIFQEINSTLENGGYKNQGAIAGKRTFGLMGDRPSGIRVIKLLKDSLRGKNPNACGGYIGGGSSIILFPNIMNVSEVATTKTIKRSIDTSSKTKGAMRTRGGYHRRIKKNKSKKNIKQNNK